MDSYNTGNLAVSLRSRASKSFCHSGQTMQSVWTPITHDVVPASKSMTNQMHPNQLSSEDMKNGKNVRIR